MSNKKANFEHWKINPNFKIIDYVINSLKYRFPVESRKISVGVYNCIQLKHEKRTYWVY